MKAHPGYKWCPTTNKPIKAQSPTVTTRKKLWAFPPDSIKEIPSVKKESKEEEMPQINFGIAGELIFFIFFFFFFFCYFICKPNNMLVIIKAKL